MKTNLYAETGASLASMLLCIFLSCSMLSCNSNKGMSSNAPKAPEHKANAQVTTAPIVPILKNHQEVRAYIGAKLAEPIPAGYDMPDYITEGLKLEQVYDTLALRYPQFYGHHSTQLLDSIAKYPLLYDKMLTENKAIRRYYDPNSKY